MTSLYCAIKLLYWIVSYSPISCSVQLSSNNGSVNVNYVNVNINVNQKLQRLWSKYIMMSNIALSVGKHKLSIWHPLLASVLVITYFQFAIIYCCWCLLWLCCRSSNTLMIEENSSGLVVFNPRLSPPVDLKERNAYTDQTGGWLLLCLSFCLFWLLAASSLLSEWF